MTEGDMTFKVLDDIQEIQEWLFVKKQESRCLEMITPGELNLMLTDFFIEGTKSDNTEYTIEQLVVIRNSIEIYLRNRHYSLPLTSPDFAEMQAALEARGGGKRPEMTKLQRQSPEVEEIMWSKGHFGSSDGEALNCTLLYYFTKFFGLTTKNAHKLLCFGDVVLRSGDENIRYLEFDPRLTRVTNRENQEQNHCELMGIENYDTFEPKLVFQGGPANKDPVLLFEKLIQHRPFTSRRPHSPMYLQPLLIHSNTAREWFESKPLSTKSLNRIIRCISRGGKVSRKRTERRQKCQSSEVKPPLQNECENEAPSQSEIITVEESGLVTPVDEPIPVDESDDPFELEYNNEIDQIMGSNNALVPAGITNDIPARSHIDFTGNFGRGPSEYERGRNYRSGQNSGGGDIDVPFSLLDVLRDDVTTLGTNYLANRSISPILSRTPSPLMTIPNPLDNNLGYLGPGTAPRDPSGVRLTGRSRLQDRRNVLRGGPPEPRAPRETSWRIIGADDIRANRYQPSSYSMAPSLQRSVRWPSHEDLYREGDERTGEMGTRSYMHPDRDGYSDRYSPQGVSLRDDYVHNTQRRIDEAIGRQRTRHRERADRRYQTQPIEFDYASYTAQERARSENAIVPYNPSSSHISYARQARERVDARDETNMEVGKVMSPPPTSTTGGPDRGPRESEVDDPSEGGQNIETDVQREQRKAIRAKLLAGNMPLAPKSPAAKKKLILDESKLEEMFLKCLICGDIFNVSDRAPKQLPCHHTLCLCCLMEMYRVETEQRQALTNAYQYRVPSAVRINCPTCRDGQIKSQEELKRLPNDRTVLSLLDLVVQSESCVVNYCSQHQTQQLNFFCETCILPVCCDCTVLDHMQQDNHVVMNIEEALKKYRPMIDETLGTLASHASELMDSKTLLESAIHTLDTNRTDVVTKLKETFQLFRSAADDREEELVEISEREIGRKKEDLSKCLEMVLKRREALQTTQELLVKAQNDENVEQIHRNHTKLKENLHDHLTIPDKLNDEFTATLDFDQTEQINVIFKLTEFGEVIFEFT